MMCYVTSRYVMLCYVMTPRSLQFRENYAVLSKARGSILVCLTIVDVLVAHCIQRGRLGRFIALDRSP